MQILIAGDSFAADWTVKYPDQLGWPNLLANKYSVENLAQAGVSEYKIYQQITSIVDVSRFDIFIVCHTSPYRIVTRKHPVHHSDVLHLNADLILSDLYYHTNTIKGLFNRSLRAAGWYVNYHYDIDYYKTTYDLFVADIERKLPKNKTILIGNSLNYEAVSSHQHCVDCRKIQEEHTGVINHFSKKGNEKIFIKIMEKINEIK